MHTESVKPMEKTILADCACSLPGGCPQHSTVNTCSLNKLGVGCAGSVVSVSGDIDIRRRLLEMGFCNGAKVEVVRRAPLGDPTEFRLRGYHLSLRQEQAKHVSVAVTA
jgi:Fe2+ transport system protein FeoA